MLKVYLAGPIVGTTYEESSDWRSYAQGALSAQGITGYSPMRYKEYLEGYDTMPDVAEEFPLSSRKGIVTRDRYDVMTCDAMLVNLTGAKRISIGTMIEIGWADAFRKPIVTVIEDGDIHQHAFVREISGFVVSTLADGIDITVKILRPGF